MMDRLLKRVKALATPIDRRPRLGGSDELPKLLAELKDVNARVRRALVDALASAPALVNLAITNPEAAEERFKESRAKSAALLEESARKIEPLAQILGAGRKDGEPALDFMKRVSDRAMDLHPLAFNDCAAAMQSVGREAMRRERRKRS